MKQSPTNEAKPAPKPSSLSQNGSSEDQEADEDVTDMDVENGSESGEYSLIAKSEED